MEKQQNNLKKIKNTGIAILLVLILIMQVIIAWGIFSDKTNDTPINDKDHQLGVVPKGRAFHGRDPFGEMDAMMEDTFKNFNQLRSAMSFDDGWDSIMASPALDMRDADSNYIVSISIPETKIDDVDVSLNGRVLSVKASTPINERNRSGYSHYERNILLPGPVGSASNICARITNGVLRINIPKADGVRQK